MRALTIALCLAATTAAAAPSKEDAWLDTLTARVVEDLGKGKPLVVEVHVPLCDNSLIDCGNKKLGDGDNPDTNLYWATTPGFGLWFARRGAGWTRVAKQRGAATGHKDVVAIEAYRRTITTPAAWKKRGAPATFELIVAIHGWRGKAIDTALDAYAADVSGGAARAVTLDDGTVVRAGGAAQLVAWVGHNRLMDLEEYRWPAPGAQVVGAIAIACSTGPYLEEHFAGPTRVPLLMTRDLLFSNAAPLEATLLAFVGGAGYATMRADATVAYAAVQKESVTKLGGIFSNPSDRRWKKR